MKLSKEQKNLAAQCVANVVREAMSGSKPPSAKKVKALSDSAAKAVVSGLKIIAAAN